MEFDKELFLSICEEYGVEMSNKYDKAMIRTDEGLKILNEFLGFAKEEYNCDIALEPSDTPDTFKRIFGISFIEECSREV